MHCSRHLPPQVAASAAARSQAPINTILVNSKSRQTGSWLWQVPWLVQMAKNALAEGKCVVIGLQSTGEARTADVVSEKGEELDDFVSGPRVRVLAGMMLVCTICCHCYPPV